MKLQISKQFILSLLSAHLALFSWAPVSLLATYIPASAFAETAELSYAKLAEAHVIKAFDVVVSDLETLSPESLPHETKTLRKRIGALRELIDIFAFAYPLEQGKDPWRELRKTLDTGYETAGVFKDLFDAQGKEVTAAAELDIAAYWQPEVTYPERELKERRKNLLKWTAGFLDAGKLKGARDYLSKPSSELTVRDEDKQSRFYWAGARLKPRADLSGIENIRRLASGLLDKAKDDERAVLKVKNLKTLDDEVQFHDFRKRIRSVVKISVVFPEVFPDSPVVKDDLGTLAELVERYGAINDLIVARHDAHKEGLDKKEEALDETLNDDWDDAKEWQEDKHIDDVISDLMEDLNSSEFF